MTQAKCKSILGYELKEKLGAGGYGEVWSAEAPGGLPKAVKLVYGYHDDHRATTELKALERIKEIRHPFLLSVERFDIVDGQLVIVTELADGCLADVYRNYIEKGKQGIPREELLTYIRDAAEALDYLSNKYSLQHLDVKPENLLVIEKHVKLADFGLVKDITQTNQSMVTGMTPIYAAPEIFDGKPGSKSDQYSLAVVYQEMLTSSRPFNGETSAQLAVQHLNEKPDLTLLPKSDQPLISKALSKNPLNRFSCCTEFVEELASRKLRKKTVHGIHDRQAANTSVIGEGGGGNHTQTEIVSGTLLPFQQQPIQKLAAPDLSNFTDWLQPTLIIAIGGMASRTVHHLKRKIVGRHGDLDGLPSIRLLCLDTDGSTINALNSSDVEVPLTDEESHCYRLKTPEYYRNSSVAGTNWLSRRWIYNIPRSQQTEGIRPLGRLAFADHFDQFCDAARDALEQITLPENIAKTSELLEATPPKEIQPKVLVVCSMNGGASGMLFDVGYLLRTLLIEEGFESESVTAILSHSIGKRATKAELSTANSLATLAELRHFVDFGYPGDEVLGIPSFDDPPFGNVYFHELGEEFRQSDLREQIGDVAEWLYLNCLSNCASFFDACRSMGKESDNFDLHTFGMKINGPSEKQGTFGAANQLVSDLILKWTTSSENEQNLHDVQVLPGFEIDQRWMMELFDKLRSNSLRQESCDQALAEARSLNSDSMTPKAIETIFDRFFGIPPHERPMNYELNSLESAFEAEVQTVSGLERVNLKNRLKKLLQQKQLRIEPIRRTIESYVTAAKQIGEQIREAMEHCFQKSERVLVEIANSRRMKNPKEFNLDAKLEEYQTCRSQLFVYRYCAPILAGLIKEANSFDGWVANSIKNLHAVRSQFCSGIFENETDDSTFSFVNLVEKSLHQSHDDILNELESCIFQEFVEPRGSYAELLDDPHVLQRSLPQTLRQLALRLTADSFTKLDVDKLVANENVAPERFFGWLNEQLNQSLPVAQNSGGNVRLMVATPSKSGPTKMGTVISQQFGIESCCLPGTFGDLIFCFEGEDISLAGIAANFVSERPRALDLSARLHSRQDIKWSRIHDLF